MHEQHRPDADASGNFPASRSRWVHLDEGRVHARIWAGPETNGASSESGAGALPIVLVHGLGVSSAYMIPLAEALAIHHPVFAPDLPGFGLSDKPGHVLDVRELASALGKWMDAMDLPRAVMVANSLGCQVVTQLAVTQPDRVVAAILQGPTTDPEARSILVQFGRLLIDAPREPLSLHPLVVRDYLKAGIRRNLQTLRYGLQDPIEERLSRMPVPTLIVRGARDPLVPQRWAERAAELLPHGRLIVLPGAAHAINYAQPKELARVIRDFLAHTVKSRSR